MNLKEIKDMINLMNENNLTELEIEREGLKVKIRKSYADSAELARFQSAQYQVESIPAGQAAGEGKPGSGATKTNLKEIVSPMVGTFYRSPSPESDPFVESGQTVEIGQVVCIVEAMKLMNEIKSEIKGKIVEVVVENAQPVEFGQTLFLVEPV